MATIRGITVQSFTKGLIRVANNKLSQDHVNDLAEQLKARAIRIYIRKAKHENTEAPYYITRFRITAVNGKTYKGYRVTNDDPMWMWIEFGAKARGKTKILRYRPMGEAMEEMSKE